MKTNRTKKVVSVLLAMTTSIPMLVACKGGGTFTPWDSASTDFSTTLMVTVYDGGYGTDWIKEAAKSFNEANSDSSYKVQIKAEKMDISTVRNYCEQGLNINRGECAYYVGTNRAEMRKGISQGVFADLSDMLTESPDNNGVTLKDKIRDYDTWQKAMSAADGTGLYSLPYSDSVIGFIFNYDQFVESGYLEKVSASDSSALNALKAQGIDYKVENNQVIFKSYSGSNQYILYKEGDIITSCGRDGIYGTYDDGQPNTIAEWDSMIKTIASDSIRPLIFTGTYSYSYSIAAFYSIIADVAGVEALETLFSSNSNGKEIQMKDGTTKVITPENGYEAYNIKGIEEALEFLYTYMNVDTTRDNNYLHPAAYLESGYSHKQAQSSYLYAQATGGTATNPESAMLYDGTWWENEARPSFNELEKANYKEYAFGKQDYRYMMYPHYDATSEGSIFSAYGSEAIVVPSKLDNDPVKSDEKLAVIKDFILYATSDEVLQNFTVETSCVQPYNYDIPADKFAQMTPFAKSYWAMYADKENVTFVRPGILECLTPRNLSENNYRIFPVKVDSYEGNGPDQFLNYINQYQTVYPNKQWISKATESMYTQAKTNWSKYFNF